MFASEGRESFLVHWEDAICATVFTGNGGRTWKIRGNFGDTNQTFSDSQTAIEQACYLCDAFRREAMERQQQRYTEYLEAGMSDRVLMEVF